MSNPYVREVGRVIDLDGSPLPIGVDYDSVSIGSFHRFTRSQAEEFARLFVAACWEAGANAERMAAEARDA